MAGLNAIPVPKSKVMNALVINEWGLLCVDALSGEEFFRLSPGSKTENISEYLAELCLDCVELGYDRLCIIQGQQSHP